MRKLKFIPVAAVAVFGALFTMQSCNKDNKLHYDLPMQTGSVEVTIPPTTDTTNTHDVGSGTNTYNIDSFIKANTGNALGINNISSVKVTSIKLTLEDGNAANNFANFQKASVTFTTNSAGSYTRSIDNNPDVEAYTMDVPVDANQELKSYLTANSFTYTVGGKLRRPITQPVKCKIEYKFNVTVQN